jgi:polar amino acid transport system permease protein
VSLFFHVFFEWSEIRSTLVDELPNGILNTLLISALAILFGTIWGMIIAVGLISRHLVFRFPARAYVDVVRGLPPILTVLVIGEGLPLAGLHPFGRDAFGYAITALAIIAGAYISEIFRSGIESVENGQMEAARGLGMSHLMALRLVIIPQGVRRVLPALANQFVAMVKDSSLVFLLGLTVGQQELFAIAQDNASNSGNLSPYVSAAIMYLIITVPLTHLVNHIDRRLRSGGRDRAVLDVTASTLASSSAT